MVGWVHTRVDDANGLTMSMVTEGVEIRENGSSAHFDVGEEEGMVLWYE